MLLLSTVQWFSQCDLKRKSECIDACDSLNMLTLQLFQCVIYLFINTDGTYNEISHLLSLHGEI